MSRRSRRSDGTMKKPGAWRRDIPDGILCLRGRRFDAPPCDRSLRPDQSVIDGFIAGSITDAAIVDSWRPRFQVTEVQA